MDNSSSATSAGDVATFRVHLVREPGNASERTVWCVSHAGREMGRFPGAEQALRAAMAYARTALHKGELQVATVTRERGDGTDIVTHVAAFR
jgi:hypothetical protein